MTTSSSAEADRLEESSEPARVDPLGYLAGHRYTCYCGLPLVGTTLCPDCADEMVARLLRRVGRALGGGFAREFAKIG